jgi:hypothetical protein
MTEFWETYRELLSAIDEFSKATSMPGGPSLAIQRHDPSWEAWKKICHAAALTPEKKD